MKLNKMEDPSDDFREICHNLTIQYYFDVRKFVVCG